VSVLRSHATTAASVIALASCSVQVGEHVSPIVGGSEELHHDAVVALVAMPLACGDRETVVCSGTVIAPRVVLTAAHCVDMLASLPGHVVIGASTHDPAARRIRITEMIANPAWDVPAHDLGLVLLAEDAGVAPLPMTGATAAPGARVELVGYGLDDRQQTGTRRAGSARVVEATPALLRVRPDPALSCPGDSGGPAIAVVDGIEQIVAVASYGDSTCRESATYARLELDLATFIAPVLARALDPRPPRRLPLRESCEVTGGCDASSGGARGVAGALLVLLVRCARRVTARGTRPGPSRPSCPSRLARCSGFR
jgi:hypothetical protein